MSDRSLLWWVIDHYYDEWSCDVALCSTTMSWWWHIYRKWATVQPNGSPVYNLLNADLIVTSSSESCRLWPSFPLQSVRDECTATLTNNVEHNARCNGLFVSAHLKYVSVAWSPVQGRWPALLWAVTAVCVIDVGTVNCSGSQQPYIVVWRYRRTI